MLSNTLFTSHSVDRAANSGRPAVKDMGIDHDRLHIALALEFLDGPNIIATFQ
jgi:hypothetical protein